MLRIFPVSSFVFIILKIVTELQHDKGTKFLGYQFFQKDISNMAYIGRYLDTAYNYLIKKKYLFMKSLDNEPPKNDR